MSQIYTKVFWARGLILKYTSFVLRRLVDKYAKIVVICWYPFVLIEYLNYANAHYKATTIFRMIKFNVFHLKRVQYIARGNVHDLNIKTVFIEILRVKYNELLII